MVEVELYIEMVLVRQGTKEVVLGQGLVVEVQLGIDEGEHVAVARL